MKNGFKAVGQGGKQNKSGLPRPADLSTDYLPNRPRIKSSDAELIQ